ncbi:MAG: YqgE/AlgH family protein [Burkholderiaceae bacterium]
MAAEQHSINLTHHFLIAMPGLVDATFAKSVIYMCEHNQRGALGLVINKPSDLKLPSLFAKVDLPLRREDLANNPVYEGGPVHTERGFVLHEQQTAQHISFVDMQAVPLTPHDGRAPTVVGDDEPKSSFYASTLCIPGGLEMTTSKDVLEALSSGAGPRKVLISLGYSSWGEGQLESELAENTWLTVEADAAVIFDTPVEQRYSKALALLGLQEWMISPEAGRA